MIINKTGPQEWSWRSIHRKLSVTFDLCSSAPRTSSYRSADSEEGVLKDHQTQARNVIVVNCHDGCVSYAHEIEVGQSRQGRRHIKVCQPHLSRGVAHSLTESPTHHATLKKDLHARERVWLGTLTLQLYETNGRHQPSYYKPGTARSNLQQNKRMA